MTTIARHTSRHHTSTPAAPVVWAPGDPAVAYRVALHALTEAHTAKTRVAELERGNDLLVVMVVLTAAAALFAVAAALWL